MHALRSAHRARIRRWRQVDPLAYRGHKHPPVASAEVALQCVACGGGAAHDRDLPRLHLQRAQAAPATLARTGGCGTVARWRGCVAYALDDLLEGRFIGAPVEVDKLDLALDLTPARTHARSPPAHAHARA